MHTTAPLFRDGKLIVTRKFNLGDVKFSCVSVFFVKLKQVHLQVLVKVVCCILHFKVKFYRSNFTGYISKSQVLFVDEYDTNE